MGNVVSGYTAAKIDLKYGPLVDERNRKCVLCHGDHLSSRKREMHQKIRELIDVNKYEAQYVRSSIPLFPSPSAVSFIHSSF